MALRSIRSGATAITEAGVLQFITDLVMSSGIFDTLAGQFLVTNGTGLAVNIATGRAYLLASGGNCYPVINDAIISNLAINTNSSGNPRITSIVLYKNLSGTPNADDSNTTFVITVDGTPAPSPSVPSLATIQAAVGSSNPFTILDDVTINSGATAPTSHSYARVTQVKFRTDIFLADAWIPYSPTAGSTLTLDLSQGKKFQINLPNGNVTLALLNVPLNCKSVLLRFTQPASGTGTITWMSGGSWDNAVVPTLTATVNKSDEFELNFLTVTSDTVNTWEGAQTHQNL